MPIEWTDAPPSDQPWAGTRLLRCPTTAPLAGLTLGVPLTGCRTHYAGGRTQPCSGPACPLCLDGHTWRWHAYLPLYNPAQRKQFVLELTATAAEDYARLITDFPNNTGLKLTVRRAAKRPNARVLLTVEAYALNGQPLPSPIDVRRFLEHLWGLDAEPPKKPGANGHPTEHKRHSRREPPGHSPLTVADILAEGRTL